MVFVSVHTDVVRFVRSGAEEYYDHFKLILFMVSSASVFVRSLAVRDK